jgi:hypothetical protein
MMAFSPSLRSGEGPGEGYSSPVNLCGLGALCVEMFFLY